MEPMPVLGSTHVTTDDGRTLAVDLTGDPNGYPVFLLHGTPGSRSGPRPRGALLYRMGVLLISFDRPGYGQSTPRKGRSVADAKDDVLAIAKKFAPDRFAVVGRSGGGPHALACAALLPKRVSCAAALVSLAPADAPDLDWYDGMGGHNTGEYSTADEDEQALIQRLTSLAEVTRHNPLRFLSQIEADISPSDRRVIDNLDFRRLLSQAYAQATLPGAEGWIDDVLAFREPWQFKVSDIRCPVKLWHGSDDQFSPIEHTLWLKKHITPAKLTIASGVGHFGAMEVLPDILSWVRRTARRADRTRTNGRRAAPALSRDHADPELDRSVPSRAATSPKGVPLRAASTSRR
jgi:pimeloyl-ACP methyl ester carboxylesterase